MLVDEVLIIELGAVDGLSTSTLNRKSSQSVDPYIKFTGESRVGWVRMLEIALRTLPLVKSPPWSINLGIRR